MKTIKHQIYLVGLLFLIFFGSANSVYGYGRSSYYDWGPYYGQGKVLGLKAYAQEPLPSTPLPQGITIPEPNIAPDSPFYFFKGFSEAVQSTFTFDPIKKQELNLKFADERLGEISYLLKKNNINEANKISQRYAVITDQVADRLKSLKESGADIGPIATKLEQQSGVHEVIAENIASYSTPVVREVVQTVINSSQTSLDRTADLSGKPALPEELSASLQNLKKQGLLTIEESNKLYGLGSRELIREELNRLNEGGLFPLSELRKLDQTVKEKYPDYYQENLEGLRFSELRSYENSPVPDDETIKKLEDFRNNYNEGTPLPQELKPYAVFNRIKELTRDIDLNSLGAVKEKELAFTYPSYIKENATYDATRSAQAASPSATIDQPTSSASATKSIGPYITPPGGLLPDSPFYFTKTIGEGIGGFFAFDQVDKLSLELDQAEERLREAGSLFVNNKTATGISSLENYQKRLDNISTKIRDLPDSPKRNILASKLEQVASRENVLLEKSIIPIPQDGLSALNSALKASQKAMDRAADVLDKPVVPPLLLDRLGSLKQQGLLLNEEVDNIVSSGSREEVREKLQQLEEKGSVPPADAKKLDEKQLILYPDDYNKLVEARKIEELQKLRQIQTEISQTSTLKQNKEGTEAKVGNLLKGVDLSVLSPQDVVQNKALFDQFDNVVASYSARPLDTTATASGSLTPDFQVGSPSAQSAVFNPPNPGLLPSSPFYFFKSGWEAVRLTISFDKQSQLSTRIGLAQSRLAEAYQLLDNGEDKRAADVFQTYVNQLKTINQELSSSSLAENTRQNIANVLDDFLAQQKVFLERMAVRTGEHTAGPISAAIIETTKALDKTSDLVKENPVPADLAEKLNNIPADMVPKETIQSLLASPTREDARNNIATLSAIGAISPKELTAFDHKVAEINQQEVAKIDQIKTVADIVKSQETVTELEKTITKNEDVVKKLTEFENNFKPGDDIPEDLRPYIPLARLDELQKTIRPDIISLEDFPNRNDIILSVATLREEFRPNKDDLEKISKFKKDNPNVALPPNLQRLESFIQNLGVRENAGPCYLPSPPFPTSTPCPPPGSPIPIAPIGSTNQSQQGTFGVLTYGQGPKPISYGFCPQGYHWMYDSGGWCMSNTGSYNAVQNYGYSYVYTAARNYAERYGLGAPSQTNRDQDAQLSANTAGYLANTIINAPPTSYSYQSSPYNQAATSNYYTYNNSSSQNNFSNTYQPVGSISNYSSYSLPPGYPGPTQTSPGVCPEGWHFMGDNGGWCMSNGGVTTNYNQYQSNPAGPGSVTNAPTYYGPVPSDYRTDDRYGYSPTNSPRPVYPGVCGDGYHWMGDSGGWCMSNGTTGSSTWGYNNSGSGNTQLLQCASPATFQSGLGCVKPSSPTGFCESYWSWVGSGCAKDGSANRSYDAACGSGYTRASITEDCRAGGSSSTSGVSNPYGTCPVGQYRKDNIDCVKTSSPYGYCEANWYWVGDSCARVGSAFGGFTAACGPGYTRTSSTANCQAGSSSTGTTTSSGTQLIPCNAPEVFRSGIGCVKTFTPYGYCDANWFWVGNSECAKAGSADRGYVDLACGPGYTRTSSTANCQAGSSSGGTSGTTQIGTCTDPETWQSGLGCVKPSSPYGYCDANFSWVGSGCARVGSADRSYDFACGSGYSRNAISEPCAAWGSGSTPTSSGQCPSGWHWMSDNGGWCMADGSTSGTPPSGWTTPVCASGQNWNGTSCGGTSSSTTTSTSPSPTPSPSTSTTSTNTRCPDGYHYMSVNYSPSGDCMSNTDSSLFTPAIP